MSAESEAINRQVPAEDKDQFWAWWLSTIDSRVRSAYLTWSLNDTVKQREIEKRERERVSRPPALIPLGKGKTSDWRDVAQGTKRVQ